MRLLLAPLEFKGTLTANQAAAAMERGLRAVDPSVDCERLPLADGGPGTVEVLLGALGGEARTARVHDPLGREVQAGWGWVPPCGAVIEMAAASGLWRLDPGERAPLKASSGGTGELIRAALDAGCAELLIGAGGSGTNDGGVGMLTALGARLLDRDGRELHSLVGDPHRLELDALDPRLAQCALIVAADVTAPLLGPTGATRVFGSQKGVRAEQVPLLERRLEQWATLLETSTGRGCRDHPGAGAAGGVAFALLALGARLRSGFDLISERVGLAARILRCDRVLTGEGRWDAQSPLGKGPWRVAELARALGRPTTVFAGSVEAGPGAGSTEVVEVTPAGLPAQELAERAGALLERGVAGWAKRNL